MNFFGKAKNILAFLLDCIFPRDCVVCGRKVDLRDFNSLCSSCISKIQWIKGARCSFCSRPISEVSDKIALAEPLVCSDCKQKVLFFKSGFSCWLHKYGGRDIVLTLKYKNAEFLKNDIAQLLKIYCPEACDFAANSILIPVPIHYFRRVGRGYNQAEIIARAIAKVADNAKLKNILRSKQKKSQTRLKRNERLLNVKNAFFCSAKIDSIPKKSRIVLVDDVSTTGTTLEECCKVLQEKGFCNLHVLTLSYG